MIKLLNNKKFKIISIVLILVIFSIVLINTKPVKHFKNNIITYFEANNYEEKDFRDAVNSMYVTMTDKKSNVIATTNPDREINSSYKFSDTTKPSKMPNTTDEYNILFEIMDTSGNEGYTKLEENVIYSMELPEYIVPQNAYDEGTNVYHECHNFAKKGKTIACGGIYQEQGKYFFKALFKDVLNKKDVKASYQFNIKLDKKIEDVVFNIKTIDFDLPGALQLFMEKEEEIVEPPVEEKDYDLTTTGEWINGNQNYAKWTVTLTDKHKDGYITNGALYVDFGPYMAMPISQEEYYTKVKVYADGVELTKTRNGNFTTLINHANATAGNGLGNISMMQKDEPDGDTSYSWSTSQLKIDLSIIREYTATNENVEGIKEWKFEFITKDYNEKPNYQFMFEANYIDNNDLNTKYQSKTSLIDTQQEQVLSFNHEEINTNKYGIPEILKYNLKVDNNNYNILELEDAINDANDTGLYYYLDALGFRHGDKLSQSLTIRIDGKEVEFNKDGYNPSSVVVGQVKPADPVVQKLMKKTDSYEYCFTNHYQCRTFYKSSITNQDGEYYWVIIGKETSDFAYSLSDGVFDYAEKSNGNVPTQKKWKIYILNAKGSDIEVEWNQNLQFYDRMSERESSNINNNNYGGHINNIITCLNNNKSYGNNISLRLLTPIVVKGEQLEENITKWEVKIDTNYLHTLLKSETNSLDSLENMIFAIDLPNNVYIASGYYYDYENNEILYSKPNNKYVGTGMISSCKDYNIKNYNSTSDTDLLECREYEEGPNSIYINNASTYRYLNGLTIEEMTHKNNSPYYNNGIYSRYYFQYNPNVFKTNIVEDYNGISKLVFFTLNTNNTINETTKIYVSAIQLNSRKNYGRESGYNYGTVTPYFAVTTASGVANTSPKKSTLTRYLQDKKIKSLYMVTKNTPSDYMIPTFEMRNLTSSIHPVFFTGKNQIKDKFSVNSEQENIIAKNTKLSTISFVSYNYYKYNSSRNDIDKSAGESLYIEDFSNAEKDSNGYIKICSNNYKDICLKVRYNYGSDCQPYSKTNSACEKYENMYYGFEAIGEGLNKSYYTHFQYGTETDFEKVIEEISYNRQKGDLLAFNNIVNPEYWNHISISHPTVANNSYFELLADLSIKKKIDKSGLNKNYKNDITKQTVVATIGHHSTKYLDITDFIDGISNLKYNSSTKTYEKEDLTVALNSLKDIRKYINISNLKIDIKPHYYQENAYKTIFSNNGFIDEYEGSTLEYIEDSNELYKLHLVRSDGEDIETETDVRITYDLNFNPDQADNYRDDDRYKGGKYYISTNVEGVRTYETVSSAPATGLSFANRNVRVQKLSSQDGDYENKIDTTKKTLTAYASNKGAAIGSDYLYPPELVKKEINKNIWEVDYYTNSAGKSIKAQLDLIDSITFTVDGNSTYNNNIIEIFKKYTKYKNLKIYYNGKNTTTSDEPYYTVPELAATNQITIDDKTGILKSTDLSLELQLNNFEYGDVIIITYEVDIDLVSAYREMYDKNYVDESNKLTDTKQAFTIKYTNGVAVPYYDESIKEQSSSKISVSDFTPSVTKRNTANNNDESSWEIRFNTGITDKSIKVKDDLKISSDNEELKSIIENSLIIKDLVIKYDNNIIYENGEFIDNWKDNITINNNKLGLELLIKDTEDNTFLANNKQFIITYKTAIDNEKYNSKISKGIFDIENSVEVEKDTLKAKDAAIKSGINYDFPMTLEKTFVGNDSTLTETNWKYTVESGRLDRENVIITDSIELGSDFSKYLSISKLKITKDEEVIFDNTKNINNLGDYELTDNENNTLTFNKNGHYQFNLNIPKLNKNSKIVVEYTLKVDDNEYIINNEILDNELLIKNKLNLKSDDGTNLEANKNASSKVTSRLRKKFNLLSNNNGVPKVRWTIDVNLLSKYSQEELVDSEVIIEDVLSDILELDPNSVIIKSRTVTTNNETIGSVIPNDKYELNTENNTVKIKLLEPNNTPNLEITFDTDCLATISELENYVTLSVDGKKEEIRSNNQVSLISPYSFGFIQSREDLIYNIEGKKLLDDKPSNKEFIFRIEEVDEEGNLKENGYYSEVTNSNDGKITFNALTFTEEGLYYYKVKEVPGNDQYIKYDDTEYTVRIKVIESHGTYIIDNLTIIDNDSNEIVFNNKTIPKEENNNVIVNPKTKTIFGIIISIIILLIIGTNISRKKTKVH